VKEIVEKLVNEYKGAAQVTSNVLQHITVVMADNN
jgi:hypothetical protein